MVGAGSVGPRIAPDARIAGKRDNFVERFLVQRKRQRHYAAFFEWRDGLLHESGMIKSSEDVVGLFEEVASSPSCFLEMPASESVSMPRISTLNSDSSRRSSAT